MIRNNQTDDENKTSIYCDHEGCERYHRIPVMDLTEETSAWLCHEHRSSRNSIKSVPGVDSEPAESVYRLREKIKINVGYRGNTSDVPQFSSTIFSKEDWLAGN